MTPKPRHVIPAITSLMSASVRVADTLRSALAATVAASRPKLLVLNLICSRQQQMEVRNRDDGTAITVSSSSTRSTGQHTFLIAAPGASMGASTRSVVSVVRKSRLPVRFSSCKSSTMLSLWNTPCTCRTALHASTAVKHGKRLG